MVIGIQIHFLEKWLNSRQRKMNNIHENLNKNPWEMAGKGVNDCTLNLKDCFPLIFNEIYYVCIIY